MSAVTVRSLVKCFAWLFVSAIVALPTTVSDLNSFNSPTAKRYIVSLDDRYQQDNAPQIVEHFASELGADVQLIRTMSGSSLVVEIQQLPHSHTLQDQLSALPGVIDVTSDARVNVASVDDPRFDEQWQLHSPDIHRASLNLPQTWDITHGSADVVVAVVDTGIDYNHPDLRGRILPGYDFVSSLSKAVDKSIAVPDDLAYMRSHDGDGRDIDASDPGDSISEATRKQFDSLDIECYVGNSSWHGTAMASIIAANVNDGIGIAGIDWHAKILPVRAIGKCGGHRSDMLDAIRWAAGVNDPSLPPNPTPARIINLSLGIDDLCTNADQSAINDAIAAGALVIAAVGNNGRSTDVQPSSPSHCQNVIGVMAVDKNGFRAEYSNFGRDADVAAPGGDASPSPDTILVATNKGHDLPTGEFGYRSATGTSVAAPHVAGVLALMLSVKPSLSNRELEALLLDSTRSFPGKGFALFDPKLGCEKAYCGTGILDAYAAVRAVENHQPGTFLDSPALAAAQSTPVSVGGYHGIGCALSDQTLSDQTLSNQTTSNQTTSKKLTDNQITKDPAMPLLCLGAMLILMRRFRATESAKRMGVATNFSTV